MLFVDKIVLRIFLACRLEGFSGREQVSIRPWIYWIPWLWDGCCYCLWCLSCLHHLCPKYGYAWLSQEGEGCVTPHTLSSGSSIFAGPGLLWARHMKPVLQTLSHWRILGRCCPTEPHFKIQSSAYSFWLLSFDFKSGTWVLGTTFQAAEVCSCTFCFTLGEKQQVTWPSPSLWVLPSHGRHTFSGGGHAPLGSLYLQLAS